MKRRSTADDLAPGPPTASRFTQQVTSAGAANTCAGKRRFVGWRLKRRFQNIHHPDATVSGAPGSLESELKGRPRALGRVSPVAGTCRAWSCRRPEAARISCRWSLRSAPASAWGSPRPPLLFQRRPILPCPPPRGRRRCICHPGMGRLPASERNWW